VAASVSFVGAPTDVILAPPAPRPLNEGVAVVATVWFIAPTYPHAVVDMVVVSIFCICATSSEVNPDKLLGYDDTVALSAVKSTPSTVAPRVERIMLPDVVSDVSVPKLVTEGCVAVDSVPAKVVAVSVVTPLTLLEPSISTPLLLNALPDVPLHRAIAVFVLDPATGMNDGVAHSAVVAEVAVRTLPATATPPVLT